MEGEYRFRMGLSLFDMLFYYLVIGLVPTLVILSMFLLMPLLVISMIGIILGDPIAFLLILSFLVPIVLLSIFMVIVMMSVTVLIKYLIFHRTADNHIAVTRKEVLVFRQGSPFYPLVMNRIPRDLIERIEPAGEDYIRERWRNTPWYLKVNMMHKYPHGGLYYPITNKRNLLILYLRSPVMVTNEEMNFLRMMRRHGPGFLRTLPVREVVLDLNRSDHEAFIHCTMTPWPTDHRR